MILYESISLYMDSITSQQDRINKMDQILDQMENSMLIIAANPGAGESGQAGVDMIEEYSLDDGQTKIRTKYRDVAAFIQSYKQLILLRNMMIARLNNSITGNVMRLRDVRNFIPICH